MFPQYFFIMTMFNLVCYSVLLTWIHVLYSWLNVLSLELIVRRLLSCRSLSLGLCLFGSLGLLDDNSLGKLLLLALAHSDGVDPGLDGVDVEVAIFVPPPPAAAGVEGDELDFTRDAEGFLESGSAFDVAVDGEEGEVALSVDVLGVELGDGQKDLVAHLRGGCGDKGKDTCLRLGLEAVLFEFGLGSEGRDVDEGGFRGSGGRGLGGCGRRRLLGLGGFLAGLVLGRCLFVGLGAGGRRVGVGLGGLLQELDHVLLVEFSAVSDGLLAASRDENEGWERRNAKLVDGSCLLVPDLANSDGVEKINGKTPKQRARSSFLREQDGLWLLLLLFQEAVNLLVRQLDNVVVDLGHDGVDNGSRRALALVVLDDRAAKLLAGADDLEGGEALDAHVAAKGLVGVIVAVDGGDLCETVEVLGGLFVGGLEVLAVAAPGGVEFDDLEGKGYLLCFNFILFVRG